MAYLLDQCPADFRGYRVLRNHPLVLVQFAEHFVEGQCGAVANGLAAVRTGLRGQVRPDVVEAAAEVWLEQGAALMRTRRSVGLVGEALRGRSFVPSCEVPHAPRGSAGPARPGGGVRAVHGLNSDHVARPPRSAEPDLEPGGPEGPRARAARPAGRRDPRRS